MTPKEFIRARSDLKLSQAALGRSLGKDVRTIGRYEHGAITIPKSIDLAMGMLKVIADMKSGAQMQALRKEREAYKVKTSE